MYNAKTVSMQNFCRFLTNFSLRGEQEGLRTETGRGTKYTLTWLL